MMMLNTAVGLLSLSLSHLFLLGTVRAIIHYCVGEVLISRFIVLGVESGCTPSGTSLFIQELSYGRHV